MQRRTVIQAVTAASLGWPLARADRWPERPVTFICTWPAGGTADATMRALCQSASKVLGQPVVVDNKAGAAGMLGLKALAHARPDGYTIGQIPISVTRFHQLGTVSVSPFKDLTYLARTSGQTFGMAVRSESPWLTLKDWVQVAKNQPGVLNYGTSGVGGAAHVGMEEFAMAAGIELRHIPYKGGAPALQDLLSGHIDVLSDSSSWAPHVQSGRLRLLATWGAQRTQGFPKVPTLRDLGYDVVVDAPNGVGAPKGIDPKIEQQWRHALRLACASPEFIEACTRLDVPVAYLDGPDYEKYVMETYRKETLLIEKLKLKESLT